MARGFDGLDDDAQQWIVKHAQRRLEHQADLTTAQDGRVVFVLTTAVALAALSALAAAIALAVPRNDAAVLVASLVALVGFSAASVLMVTSVRSRRFKTPGGQPSEFLESCSGSTTVADLRTTWLAQLDACLSENEALLEERRQLGNWALWTLTSTPAFALICGWLAAT